MGVPGSRSSSAPASAEGAAAALKARSAGGEISFADAAVDGELLCDLDGADLEQSLGVGHRLHRKKLLGAIDALTQRGEVREALLPYLWRSLGVLRRDDYDSVIRMLVIGGVLIEERAEGVVSAAGERSWVMPMRLPDETPSDQMSRWHRMRTQSGVEQLGIAYPLGNLAPPGISERLIAACHRLGRYRPYWQRGGLLQGCIGAADSQPAPAPHPYPLLPEEAVRAALASPCLPTRPYEPRLAPPSARRRAPGRGDHRAAAAAPQGRREGGMQNERLASSWWRTASALSARREGSSGSHMHAHVHREHPWLLCPKGCGAANEQTSATFCLPLSLSLSLSKPRFIA